MRRLIVSIVMMAGVLLGSGLTAKAEVYQADYVPWSGYWWPFTKGGLVTGKDYRGYPAPLVKYDTAVHGISNGGPAATYGYLEYYDPDALSWEGMCFCWAAAAILEPEPVHKGFYNGTLFNVGDKKGILTTAYHGTLFNLFKFKNPVDFHKVLEDFIKNQKIPIMIDIGTDGEIWNYPVFKYSTQYTQEGNRRHYTTTIYFATNAVKPDFVGSVITSEKYYYYFDTDEKGTIINSGWEGSSVASPPIKAVEPFGTEPVNPGIDYAAVKQIVSADDDLFEANDTVLQAASVSSGRFTLLAIDEDYYKIQLKAGDKLVARCDVKGTELLLWQVYSPAGNKLGEALDTGVLTLSAALAGDYVIRVSPNDPSSEAVYDFEFQQRLAHEGILPYDAGGIWRTGLALLNEPLAGAMSPPTTDRVIISEMSLEGNMQKAHSAVFSTSDKLVGMSEADFGLTGADDGYFKIYSDRPVSGLQATMANDDIMIGTNVIPVNQAASSVYYPHIARAGGWKTFLGFINTGDQDERVVTQAFDGQGAVTKQDVIELAGGQKIEYDATYLSFLSANTACLGASTESGRDTLVGYVLYYSPSSVSPGRDMVPLPLERVTELFIPYIADAENFWTGVAIMNRSDQSLTVTCFGYDADGRLIQMSAHALKPKQNLVKFASGLFGVADSRLASVRLQSSVADALSGLLLYGSRDNGQIAGIQLVSGNGTDALCLPHTADFGRWWNSVSVMNVGGDETEVAFELFGDNRVLLASASEHFAPNQRKGLMLRELFGEEAMRNSKYVKMYATSGQPVTGLYLIGYQNAEHRQLMGGTLSPLP